MRLLNTAQTIFIFIFIFFIDFIQYLLHINIFHYVYCLLCVLYLCKYTVFILHRSFQCACVRILFLLFRFDRFCFAYLRRSPRLFLGTVWPCKWHSYQKSVVEKRLPTRVCLVMLCNMFNVALFISYLLFIHTAVSRIGKP